MHANVNGIRRQVLNFRQILANLFRDFSKMQEQQEKIPNGQRGADSEGPTAEGRPSMAALLAAPLGLKPAALCDLLGGLLAPLPLDVEDGELCTHPARHSADGLWKLEPRDNMATPSYILWEIQQNTEF